MAAAEVISTITTADIIVAGTAAVQEVAEAFVLAAPPTAIPMAAGARCALAVITLVITVGTAAVTAAAVVDMGAACGQEVQDFGVQGTHLLGHSRDRYLG